MMNTPDKPLKTTYASYTFTHKPLFTKKDVESITKKATLLQKFKLLFKRSHYTFDEDCVIRYKRMGDTIYVMKRGSKL